MALAKTIKKYLSLIHNTLDHGVSNALSEATNSHLRLLTCRAYGYHSADALIAMATLTRGGPCQPYPDDHDHPPTETAGGPLKGGGGEGRIGRMLTEMTIDDALQQFLDEQRKRLSPRTMANYEYVIELLRDCLNGYAYQSLSGFEKKRWEKAFNDGDEEAFCKLFGPDKIVENYGEFLGYFMIRKVMAGQELLKASGTVTKKLAKWLGEQGLISGHDSADAVDRATEASVDLPKAEKLASLLYEQSRLAPDFVHDNIAGEDWVEDYLAIEKVEADAIWLEGNVGPVRVPNVGNLAQAGWSVNIVLARLKGEWHVVEVGNVYP